MKWMQTYFNYAYTPVYDFTTARLNRYRELQERCVSQLQLEDNDKVLCVGVGTGNEIFQILKNNRKVDIVGIDYSHTALRKAHKKALTLDKEIQGLLMDARYLEFAAGSFDKVLCIHVMDFIEDNKQVTDEILRVLKDGGQFVITYPLHKEGPRLGVNLFRDSFYHSINSGRDRIKAVLEPLTQMLVGLIYLPLLFRLTQKSYSRNELEAMFNRITNGDFRIEEDSIYQDFIVYGKKLTVGG